MKKALFALAIFAMAALGAKAQDSVFSYTYQGTTLYYIIDSVGNATVVPPLWPGFDETNDATWTGYTEPSGAVAYGDCSSIVTASLPGSLGEVPAQVFYGCTSLATVTIGDGITAIQEQAFNQCPNIDTIFMKCAVPPTVGTSADSTFFTYNSVLVVPCGSYATYFNNPIADYFSAIVEECEVGIPDVSLSEITIRIENDRIIVGGAEDETVSIFDINGRSVRNSDLPNGVYIVKIGNRQAKKVVVTR